MSIVSMLHGPIRVCLLMTAAGSLAAMSPGTRAQSYNPESCRAVAMGSMVETELNAFCRGYNGGSCVGEEYDAACAAGVDARRTSGESAGATMQQQDELEQNRRAVQQLPMLAPKGNPLLGRWRRVANVAPPPRGLLESLVELGNDVVCAAIAGDGPNFEFRADALMHGTRTMDSMRYFGGQNGVVIALGERYRPPLAFEFDGPNRAILSSCVFERVGAAAAAPTPASGAGGAPSASVKSAGAACGIPTSAPGVATVASVEQDILARGGTPSSNTDPVTHRVSTLSGDYPEIGRFMAVNYDFATRDPASPLKSVGIVRRARTSAEFDRLLAERKAASSMAIGPLQQTSETEYRAARPGCQVKLIAEARTLYLYELYELPE